MNRSLDCHNQNTLNKTLWDVQCKRSHRPFATRAGLGVAGVVICLSVIYHGWEGKFSMIIISYMIVHQATLKSKGKERCDDDDDDDAV